MKKMNENEREQQVDSTTSEERKEEAILEEKKEQEQVQQRQGQETAERTTETTPEAVRQEQEETAIPAKTKSKTNVMATVGIFVLLLFVVGVAVTLIKSSKKETPVTVSTISETKESVAETVESIQKTEIDTEPVVETESEEVSLPETEKISNSLLQEWISSLEYDEYKYCIWNEEKGQGEVLENGNSYEITEDDVLVLYKPEPISSFTTPGGVNFKSSLEYDSYIVLNMEFYQPVEYFAHTTSTSGDTCEFEFTLVPALTEELLAEMTGEEWADILISDTPEFIVWNDTTGLKKEIVEGEEYQLQQDDVLAIYCGKNYNVITTNPIRSSILYGNDNYSIVNFYVTETTEITATLALKDDESNVIDISFTLIPTE